MPFSLPCTPAAPCTARAQAQDEAAARARLADLVHQRSAEAQAESARSGLPPLSFEVGDASVQGALAEEDVPRAPAHRSTLTREAHRAPEHMRLAT